METPRSSQERDAQIKQLFEELAELPVEEHAAFFREACRRDTRLRQDLETRLRPADSTYLRFDLVAWDVIQPILQSLGGNREGLNALLDGLAASAGDITDELVGATVSHFRIIAPIGQGSMGVVYRAHDTRLDRTVALKFLPWSLCQNAETKARFIQEAKAASALDHVNITTIHEIGETLDGQLFIAMALHSGETLRRIIERGPLSADRALDYVAQLASALSTAHAQGIVHRDIKPANVMVTTDGVTKLLDFGVAKLGGGTLLTQPGTMVGTAAYMSPEQAGGEEVDHRTDIWSLGVVWQEMLTGELPFRGDDARSVMGAILHHDPKPIGKIRPDLPDAIERMVATCLAKDPAYRYQQADELLADLRRFGEGQALAPRRGRPWWAGRMASRPAQLVAGAALLAVAIAGVLVFVRSPDAMPVFSRARQVSTSSALEDYPAISPDGRTVAYESNEAGKWDIWVSQPGAEASVNRTGNLVGDNRYPSWSPDGRTIAFWSDRDGGGYHAMPAFGGPAQPLVSTRSVGMQWFSPAAWSADGGTLGVVQYPQGGPDDEPVVALLDLATRETQEFALPGIEEARLDPAWSPDGSMIAYVDAAQQPAEATTLRVLHLATGSVVAVTDGSSNVRSPMWRPDSRTLMFASGRSGSSDLWMCRLTEAGALADPPRQTTTARDIRHASISHDTTAMAFSKGRWVANIWRVPIRPDRLTTWADAEALTSEHVFIEFISLSPDGQRLAFSSDRRGNQDIWTMSADGGDLTRLTSHPAQDWAPDWSPDGSRIAFYSDRTGDREIWVTSGTGESATRITHSPGLDATPRWSPNGRELVWRSERDGNSDIWVGAADGSGERQITDDPAGDYAAVFSPDGAWIYFTSQRSGQSRLWRVPASGGEAEPLTEDGVVGSMCWSPDGQILYLSNWMDSSGNLWAFSLDDQRAQPITDLSGRRGELSLQAPATDGNFLYFSWREDLGDVWVMDVSYGARK